MKLTDKEIADKLNAIYSTGETCDKVSDVMKVNSLVSAYAIQDINTNRWLEEGRVITGCKIGLTSPAVQKQLGVDQPDFGMLYEDMICLDGATVPTEKLLQPKVEAELAIVLNKPLTKEKHSIENILDATDYVLPAIEIVDSRISNWKITITDTIADNASSALYAIGKDKVKPSNVEWEHCSMQMFDQDELVSQGKGSDCMGNPLIAAAWLADKMVEMNRPLQAGHIILTGALGPMYNIKGGEKIRTEISSVGTVSISFTKPNEDE